MPNLAHVTTVDLQFIKTIHNHLDIYFISNCINPHTAYRIFHIMCTLQPPTSTYPFPTRPLPPAAVYRAGARVDCEMCKIILPFDPLNHGPVTPVHVHINCLPALHTHTPHAPPLEDLCDSYIMTSGWLEACILSTGEGPTCWTC